MFRPRAACQADLETAAERFALYVEGARDRDVLRLFVQSVGETGRAPGLDQVHQKTVREAVYVDAVERAHAVLPGLRELHAVRTCDIEAIAARLVRADLEAGRIRAIVDRVLPLSQAADAHRAMKASEHFGKIILEP